MIRESCTLGANQLLPPKHFVVFYLINLDALFSYYIKNKTFTNSLKLKAKHDLLTFSGQRCSNTA